MYNEILSLGYNQNVELETQRLETQRLETLSFDCNLEIKIHYEIPYSFMHYTVLDNEVLFLGYNQDVIYILFMLFICFIIKFYKILYHYKSIRYFIRKLLRNYLVIRREYSK